MIIALIIFVHLMIGGAAYRTVQNRLGAPHCSESKSGRRCNSDCGHNWLAPMAVIIWPLILPVALGIKGGDLSKAVGTRTERRRQREIDEANHKVNLAQIRAKETEALEKALEKS